VKIDNIEGDIIFLEIPRRGQIKIGFGEDGIFDKN